MTPTERTAIGVDVINSYIYSLSYSFADYTRKVADEFSMSKNRHSLELYKIRLILVEAYLTIILNYLEETMEGDDNFCTTDEIYRAMRHFNNITNTNYWITL